MGLRRKLEAKFSFITVSITLYQLVNVQTKIVPCKDEVSPSSKLVSQEDNVTIFNALNIPQVLIDKMSNALENKSIDPDTFLHPVDIIQKYGYPVECHLVNTDDDYLLTFFRIKHGKKNKDAPRHRRPVYIGHGLLSSAADWLLVEPDRVLPYRLAEEGYDVWLGNSRGNKYSAKHYYKKTDAFPYWDFSVHEMGKFDNPATFRYITNESGFEKIDYIGYSMSTTSFFICMSESPWLNSKIRKMVAIAPAVFLNNTKSPARVATAIQDDAHLEMHKAASGGQVAPWILNKILNKYHSELCHLSAAYHLLCKNAVNLLAGPDPPERNQTVAERAGGHMPSSSAARTLIHYLQFFRLPSNFRKYDFGKDNQQKYGSDTPPAYDLTQTTAQILVMYGGNDYLTVPKDVNYTMERLTRARITPILIEDYNHLDFIYGDSISTKVVAPIIKYLNE